MRAGARVTSPIAILESSDPIRLLHVTDPHLFAEPESSLRGRVTRESLNRVLGHIKQEAWPADRIIMTGDVSQDESVESYRHFMQLFAATGLPVHCVPGNHDDRGMMQQLLNDPPFHYCDQTLVNNWFITGIDSCINGEAGGQFGGPALAELERQLSDTAADHVLVSLHHPPVAVGSRWLDRVGLHNAAEFIDVLSRSGKVRATVFGHVHQAVDATESEIRMIGTPSTCRQFKKSSDEFALDGLPPAYRRLTLTSGGSVKTELIWVEDA